MPLEHACFISFPRGAGKDTVFADLFHDEFSAALATYDKTLSIFKFDRCEHRRHGDDWTLWIQRELCHSAMMIAVCAPNYFNGSLACVSEFRGMERLIGDRTTALGGLATKDWLVALRLKDTVPMPALNPYDVVDFLECCASPQKVRKVQKHREVVDALAYRVWLHWQWLKAGGRSGSFDSANICGGFSLPPVPTEAPDEYPHAGGVR